jgi:hypothetical protein
MARPCAAHTQPQHNDFRAFNQVYRLAEKEVNGRPAFQKTDRDDRWLAFNGDSAWNAQSAASLGIVK